MLWLQQICQQVILGSLTISFDLLHAFANVVAVEDMAGVDQAVLSAVRAKHQAEPRASTFLPPCLCRIQGLQSLAVTTYVQHLILDPAACVNLLSLQVHGGGFEWSALSAGLPECIVKLQQLRSLTVWASNLRCIGINITQMASLTHLDVSGNELEGDFDGVNHLTLLQHLDLSNNMLLSEHCVLDQLQGLTYLDLSHNQLKAIPDSLASLSNLQELNLSHNWLSGAARLGRFCYCWPKLRDLSLFNVSDKFGDLVLPKSLSHLSALTTLNVGDNLGVGYIMAPQTLASLTVLKQLPSLQCVYLPDMGLELNELPAQLLGLTAEVVVI
eukprot:jgi/Chrzof1/9925/Cz04g20300.t1